MKRKHTLLVAMTALFCAFGAGQLWAATALENTHLQNNVRIESITKSTPTNTEYPVATEVYFDVKLVDLSAGWQFTGNSFDATSGTRPYLLLNMPLAGTSTKLAAGTEAAATEETATAVAYYVGQAPSSPDTLRFTYVVRPGDMTSNLTWAVTDAGAPAFGGDIKSVKMSAVDTSTGPLSGAVNLTDAVMQGSTDGTVADTGKEMPVSGYTFTVGDAENANEGMLYAGLVPVTVTTIAPDTGTRTTLATSSLYSNAYFWVETADGTQYYNAGVTLIGDTATAIKEGEYGSTAVAAFSTDYAAKVTGMNKATFTSQKFLVSIPDNLAGEEVRLCYGVRRDKDTITQTTYAYATYTVEASPVPNATKGWKVQCASMDAGTVELPADGLKAAYTNLLNTSVQGGTIVLAAGESATVTIEKKGKETLADAGTLYASIELISDSNEASATFERYDVPIASDGTVHRVKLTIGDTDTSADSYYRVRVPALEDANDEGTLAPFYIKVTSSPKRETITLSSSETTGQSGVEYYEPLDAAATGVGSYNILEYTLTVAAADDKRYFIIYPTDSTQTKRIDKNATMVNLTDADGNPVNAYNLIASYATLQTQSSGVMFNAEAELKVTVPAGETSVKFYVVCRNDFASSMGLLTGEVNTADSTDNVELAGVLFTAKTCNSKGEITGTLDECDVIMPTVANRIPTISTSTAPSNMTAGTVGAFTFTVADTISDYLVLTIDYGDGETDAVLLANEDAMIKMMGKANWDAKLNTLKAIYGVGADKELTIVDRTLAQQSYTFNHTYASGSTQEWFFSVIDSSNAQATKTGSITLKTSQNFLFNTIYNVTLPASGYILWDNGSDKLSNWTFGQTYTSNALAKNGSNTLVTVAAKPFPAGYLLQNPDDATALKRYNGLSETYDSFFYKWTANSDFEGLLPMGTTEEYRRYEEVLSFSRAYVKDGEAEDSSKWQDIQLSAIFVAEYLPGDSLTSRSKDSYKPYLYELGDYNNDGVPDGWILKHMGETARTTLIEGTSIANASPGAAEYLPRTGFGGGDSAYVFGASDGRLPIAGAAPLLMEAGSAAFGYKMRIRGRDEALNAADGAGNWLSAPAWIVVVHPEKEAGVVQAGSLDDKGVFTPLWKQIKLSEQMYSTAQNVELKRTAANQIPYDAANVDANGWAYVIDADGNPIKPGYGNYVANSVMINVIESSPDYEAFRYTYDKWGVDKNGTWEVPATEVGALFPFTTKADADAAMTNADTGTGLTVDQYAGAKYAGEYRFIDARGVAGILLDEPFKLTKNDNDVIDPRLTSWLERFVGSGVASTTDSDEDGITNAAEYYFWYYASRIAYGSVFKNNDGIQLNTALWPAIDMRQRKEWNTDGRYGTKEMFTMGRRYRADYNPDAPEASVYGKASINTLFGTLTNEYTLESHIGNASHGKGNYWEPIPVETVLNNFDPFGVWNQRDFGDIDNDGLSASEELALGLNPIDCDTDNDWMIDGFEVKYGLDPFNLKNNGENDAEANPDGDTFAYTAALLYPDYHHLFKVSYVAPTPDPAATDPIPEAPWDETTHVAYYDYEAKAIQVFTLEDTQDVVFLEESNITATLAFDDVKDVIAWQTDTIFLKMSPEFLFLRDFEVYRAFGFNCKTAVSGDKTKAFCSREEFNSSLKRGNWATGVSPVSADSNEDGVPDGWQLYVGMQPYPDPLYFPKDGARDPDSDGLSTAQEYAHNATYGWTNKTAPTDPWNPDSDFDGIWDGDEGSKFTYGTPVLTDDNGNILAKVIAGGGCDPNSADTDGDGMSDAWEYVYGKPGSVGGSLEDEFAYSLNGVIITYTAAPDPTRSNADDNFKRMEDYDLDYDLDGLTNYQEYLVSTLRHLRYDLGPEMAALYLESPGEKQESTIADTPEEWVKLPDAYAPGRDLVNPSTVLSPEFAFVERGSTQKGDNAILFMMNEPGTMPLLAQSIASMEWVHNKSVPWPNAPRDSRKMTYAPAIGAAFNYNWNSTIAFPTEDELVNYGLVSYDFEKASPAVIQTATKLALLPGLFTELDMAWKRLLSESMYKAAPIYNMGYYGDNAFITVESDRAGYNAGKTTQRNLRQVESLITIIDKILADLKANTASMQPVMKDLMQADGDTQLIWANRRDQILKALSKSFPGVQDPCYNEMPTITGGAQAYTNPLDEMYTSAASVDMGAYEEALTNATNPLLKSRYRAAMRGFNGGLWKDGASFVCGTPAWHGVLKPFSLRQKGITDGQGTVLGVPLPINNTSSPLGGIAYPGYKSAAGRMMATNPLVADTDRDGMDDYFEVFHGLNPVLGDYTNAADENVGMDYSAVDQLSDQRREVGGSAEFCHLAISPDSNPFGNPALTASSVTGYDYYSYPWLAGVPFADPDGDGLVNSEEAVNPVTSNPAHYGTDPSPLWMTDPENVNSFVSRFYAPLNKQWGLLMDVAELSKLTMTKYVSSSDNAPTSKGSFFPYEVNEGYDTDGDGVSDLTELTSNTIFRGDPQTLRTPDRQQAAYFGGKGALQTMADTQFGPQALTTFTVECWVKPDADQTSDEVILVDRPWRFNDGLLTVEALRHNFVLGLTKDGDAFRPFGYYTGSGTTDDLIAEETPVASPRVEAGQTIKADEWNHIALVYDGARLTLILNGVESAAQAASLIPANGVISVYSTVDSDVRRFTYRKAPIMIGATAAQAWMAAMGDADDALGYDAYFTKSFKGFIDEVRIWNGARTAAQIAEARARNLTQAEMLTARYNAFIARKNGMGYYEANTPVEPLAVYTFNDLLSGARNAATADSAATAADEPWERYPSQQLVGDGKPGSLMYRRTGFRATLAGAGEGGNALITKNNLPAETDLFTSYYTLTASKALRSTQYKEGEDAEGYPISEFVPMAHNTVAHLPLADIQRTSPYNYLALPLMDGSPELTIPSGSAEHLKVADSFYWSPYRAGAQISTEKVYEVKTTGNPYGYRYHGSIFFDLQDYIVRDAFSTQYPSDLLIYGDVFAKYDFATWDNSPTTDPSAGKTDENSTVVSEGADWFRHHDVAVDLGDGLNGKQFSNGAYWLDQNIAVGQKKDSDADLMPNWWENYYGLDPEDATGNNGRHGDQDGDFLTNYAEYLASANPLKYSTVGNGVPDSQIPVWFHRGSPTFSLLYTDGDFMEDHWEDANRSDRLSTDIYDAHRDADNDGWSNFAEARANFRTGAHSTNPNAATSFSQTGAVQLEMPTPAIRMTVDYFGDQNVYTNAVAGASIVVQSYTAKNNNSAPDATFKLPLVAGEGEATNTFEHEIGAWKRGTMSGYLHGGNIMPGSLKIKFSRMSIDSSEDEEDDKAADYLYFLVRSNSSTENDVAELYAMLPVYWQDATTGEIMEGEARQTAGWVNYRTGEYQLDFSDPELWPDKGSYMADNGSVTVYERTEFVGVATYQTGVVAGTSNTYTLVKPDEGYIKEGANNFFVFADLDADGKWDDTEPAGVPDQHDVEIGFDQVNETLHVALTTLAPPGAIRLDVASILGVLLTENENADAVSGDISSLVNPSTGKPLSPSDFAGNLNYWLILTKYETIGTETTVDTIEPVVYQKQFNINKPYLSEDEIFANEETKTGLPGTDATNQFAASYKVYLLPETELGAQSSTWTPWNIAVVTNVLGSLDADSTAMVAPVGGTYIHNSELYFEWKSNVQVPSFALTITKKTDGAGNETNVVVYKDDEIRGVTPSGTAPGTGAVEQFIYRYKLPRGIGELTAENTTLFGDGSYTYDLTLSPYGGTKTTLKGAFNIQLNGSDEADFTELKGAVTDTSFNAQDSYYLRAQIRYNGVLLTDDKPLAKKLVVEAHYSGSFNGNPVASTTDILTYDANNETLAALNRCVHMVKDKEDGAFFSTRFDVELRGLATSKPVYLMAYFDLNANGKRDIWEPWGYAAQGLDAVDGYYFDPAALTPMVSGNTWQTEFYIQDMDADSDKLSDAWEWKSAGMPTTDFFDNGATAGWCNTYTGTYANLLTTNAIWTTDIDGNVALTAYGAQVYGLTATSEPDANGAVKVEGIEDAAAAKELLELLGNETALELIAQGYTSYGLTVDSISYNGDVITLTWAVESAVSTDGAVYDLTALFAEGTNTSATYSVYGTATLGGTWTKLAEVKVTGTQTPQVSISATDAEITAEDGTTSLATFFKVILSAAPMSETLE